MDRCILMLVNAQSLCVSCLAIWNTEVGRDWSRSWVRQKWAWQWKAGQEWQLSTHKNLNTQASSGLAPQGSLELAQA